MQLRIASFAFLLSVAPTASTVQIRKAYFCLRSDIYQTLQPSDENNAFNNNLPLPNRQQGESNAIWLIRFQSIHSVKQQSIGCGHATTESFGAISNLKKLKEASNEINAEKKVTQHNADPMMKDSRKLKLESESSKIKIKNDAVKQAMVLKRKIDEADLLELEKRLKMSSKCDLFCRLIWSEIEKSRKQKFEA
eukprot:scaffold22285_cov70-Cyclotella_meneghiniana.AAC.14